MDTFMIYDATDVPEERNKIRETTVYLIKAIDASEALEVLLDEDIMTVDEIRNYRIALYPEGTKFRLGAVLVDH